MPSVTLLEAAKLSQDLLLQGVIETIVTTDQFFGILPFMEISGNALAYNRENAMGDAQFATVGTTITAKAAATFTPVSSALTKIIGDAEVDEFIAATQSDITDQKAVQILSKAKSVARTYASSLIVGDGTGESFKGLLSLAAESQTLDVGANGAALSFDILDELLDMVKDKDGVVDYIVMPSRTLRSYYALLRAIGGASINEVVTLPSGIQVPAYRNTPIFRNDFIPTNQDQGTSTGVCTSILAGTFDDGSGKIGISGLTARGAAGIRIQDIGVSESKDESITRVKWYTGLANFSELGLAVAPGITN